MDPPQTNVLYLIKALNTFVIRLAKALNAHLARITKVVASWQPIDGLLASMLMCCISPRLMKMYDEV